MSDEGWRCCSKVSLNLYPLSKLLPTFNVCVFLDCPFLYWLKEKDGRKGLDRAEEVLSGQDPVLSVR